MNNNLFYDGIHLKENGVRVYVKCLKETINPLVGVHTPTSNNTGTETQKNIHYRHSSGMSGINCQSPNTRFNPEHMNQHNRIGQTHFNRYNQTVDDKQTDFRTREFYAPYNQYGQQMYNNKNQYQHRYNTGYTANNTRYPNINNGQNYMNGVDQNQVQNTKREQIFKLFEQMLRAM